MKIEHDFNPEIKPNPGTGFWIFFVIAITVTILTYFLCHLK
jgi:hypothetical protein